MAGTVVLLGRRLFEPPRGLKRIVEIALDSATGMTQDGFREHQNKDIPVLTNHTKPSPADPCLRSWLVFTPWGSCISRPGRAFHYGQ